MSTKYDARAKKVRSLVCVGLDADFHKLPERFTREAFPQFAFCKWIIDETHEHVAAYKPNSAFFEARGEGGMHELQMTIEYLKENHPTIFTILDAKRADIGNTNQGYVESIFDRLGFDAVTVHPYLGAEALGPFLERKDKTTIVLCRTSNEGAKELQDLLVEGAPLWEHVAKNVKNTWNANDNCMLVVGATYPGEMKRVREIAPDITFLVPGVGAQGGDVKAVVEAGGSNLIISSSRAIIFSGDPKAAAKALQEEINSYR
ncbi:MAG: orotidine-5'-phosphate decarboxylase [Candidatus Pacebacteria bacterium]|nr:orotidine-5'-phosphate decarboxylase [Candidatus Paceibacterota bacterium]